jgi:hypothetical protein
VPKLTLYGKPGCHLCDDARRAVERATAGRDIVIEQIDISLDPALNARYGQRIPVLDIDGETAFELFVDAGVLGQRLDRVGA